mgnify:FL=1|tara:strand:- start:193 stop:519 length:327 start_codon:yes stop_codon:yes gene_type:complete
MNTETLTTTQLETVISNYRELIEAKKISVDWKDQLGNSLLDWVLECARELEFRQEDTDYLTRDQVADLLGNDAYIHVSDYEDLEAVSEQMREVTYVVGHYGRRNMVLR